MSLRKKLISGVFFTAISKYANVVISLVVTAVLSRLMLPEQFGVVAIASVAISFLSIFADIGLTATIIQYTELQKKDLGILFTMSFYLAVILSLLVFIGGNYLADYYNEPLLTTVCQLLSVNLFFSTISVVPNAIFYREKMFKQIAIRSFIAQLLGGIVAVVWALQDGGIYALIVNPILSSILIFSISYSRFPLNLHIKFSLATVAHTFKYSLFQFLFNIINFFSRNMDTLVIGKALGASSLGYYDKAYRLMSLPLQNITQVITPVLHPLLSGYKSDTKYLMNINESITKMLAVIGFPLSIWLYFVADELIFIFFGDQWGVAVPAFQFLSLTVGIQLVLSSSGSFFQTSGNTRALFICGVFSATLNVIAILVGAFYFRSIETVAQGLLITFSINFIQAYWLLYRQVFFVSSVRFFKIIIKPLIFSVLLAVVYRLLLLLVPVQGVVLSILWKSIVYVLAMLAFIFLGGYKSEIMDFIKRKQLPID